VNGGKLNLGNVQATGPLLCYLIPIVALPCGEEYEFFYCPISLVVILYLDKVVKRMSSSISFGQNGSTQVVKSRDGQVDAPLHVAGGIFI